MDWSKVSAIAHRDLDFAGPYDPEPVDDLIGLVGLGLGPGARVLDVGCGKGEMLLRILERHPEATGEGVDHSAYAIREAGRRGAERGVSDRLVLHETDIAGFHPELSAYDLAICVGSTHLYGGLSATLRALMALLRPEGRVVVGEGFWERPPTPAALAALDASEDELADLAGTLRVASAEGFTPLSVSVCGADEWDRYESSWVGSLERYAREHPEDPDVDEIERIARDHMDGYLGGYRGVLGFALMLLARA